jgi:endonuclease-3 related protein
MDKTFLTRIYNKLLEKYGYQKWWPLTGFFEPFEEICIGAILTQNTNWKNVEKALKNLISNQITSFKKILEIDEKKLSIIIKPSGFYNQKAKTLKRTAKFITERGKENLNREKLLSIKGIGKETADTILLYGLDKYEFVIDAYTKRFFYRLGITESEKIEYDKLKKYIQDNIPKNITLYKEYHALIVQHCKTFCTKNPNCKECFLKDKCYNYLHGKK